MTQTSLFSTARKTTKPAAPKAKPARTDDSVARTILEQMGGTGRLVAMAGAKGFVYDANAVSFKFPNRDRNRPNYCKVELAADDTYTVTFGRIVKWDLRSASTVEGIYWDQLVELFENATGIYLSL